MAINNVTKLLVIFMLIVLTACTSPEVSQDNNQITTTTTLQEYKNLEDSNDVFNSIDEALEVLD